MRRAGMHKQEKGEGEAEGNAGTSLPTSRCKGAYSYEAAAFLHSPSAVCALTRLLFRSTLVHAGCNQHLPPASLRANGCPGQHCSGQGEHVWRLGNRGSQGHGRSRPRTCAARPLARPLGPRPPRSAGGMGGAAGGPTAAHRATQAPGPEPGASEVSTSARARGMCKDQGRGSYIRTLPPRREVLLVHACQDRNLCCDARCACR